jgi:hypothetical protein
MARRQRRSARRRNGVGAYQIRFGRLLRGAKLKGKSAAERRASFRKLIEKARSGKPSASDVAAAKKANAAYVAKRRARKARRGGLTRKAYKAMSPKARRMMRRAKGIEFRRGPKQLALLNPRRRRASARRRMSARRLRMLRNLKGFAKMNPRKARKASRKGARRVARRGARRSARRGARRPSLRMLLNPMRRRKASRKVSRKARRGARRSMKALRLNPRRRAMKLRRNRASRRASSRRSMSKRGMFAGAISAAKGFSKGLFTPAGLLSAAAVGVAHGVVAPKVHDVLAKYLPYSITLPVVGKVSAASFSYTATGALAGAALSVIGKKLRKPAVEKMGYAAALSGVVLDVVGLVQQARAASYGAIYDDGVTYGAIYDDGVTYGGISADGVTYGEIYNDGQTYGGISADGVVEYGDVMIAEYGDAMPADAMDSGADFNAKEGQALLAGPFAWLKRFGRAPTRVAGVRTAKSRHAGREGHRWGWLIKLVGPEKAAQIAAMPPQKRLDVIAKLRRQALDSVENLMAEKAAATTTGSAPAANLLPAPQDMGLDLTGAVSAPGGAIGYGAVYAGGGF